MRDSFLAFVVVFSACLAVNLPAQTYEGQKGDVNNDGSINVLDMLIIANHILGIDILTEQEFWRADLNGLVGNCDGDEDANVLDMVKIANIILCKDECPGTTVTDIDGNVYQTVRIGDQVWTAENLKVTHYRNGDAIPNVTDYSNWFGLSTGAYCNYSNNIRYGRIYGRLYNGFAVCDNRGVAPEGWHVPSDAEWKQLEMRLGMSQSEADAAGWRGTGEGGKMKEPGLSHWHYPNTGASNTSGFSALPGGYRDYNGSFDYLGNCAWFWSSTESEYNIYRVWERLLDHYYSEVSRAFADRHYGFSVRCVRDN